jgi:EREBP-like factor
MPKRRAGRKKFKETRQPFYRGIRRRKKNKWVSEMRKPNEKKRIWLGTYPSAEMAARAHDVAALALRGTFACLNLADSAWSVHLPASTDLGEIRRRGLAG